MKNKIGIIVLAAVVVVGSIVYAFASQLTSDRNTVLVVGTAGGYAPWVSVNEQGEYEGFDVDVIKLVAREMGKNLILKDLGSMSSLLIALQQGNIDAIIWGMSITQDRLQKMNMVRYQGDKVTAYPLLFWQKIPVSVQSIRDMEGMTVCVEPASAQDTVLGNYSGVIKKPVDRIDDALTNIRYKRADAALVEPAIAKKFQRKYPEIKTLYVPLSSENQVLGVGICLALDNRELTQQIQKAVDRLEQRGVVKGLETQWGIA